MALCILSLWFPFLLLLLPILLLIHKNSGAKRSMLPPSPPKLPIIGNLHQLGELPHRSLWQLSKKYGPIMHLRLGRVPTLVVSSAEVAREILKTHDLECCNRPLLVGPKRLSYNLLDMAFAPYSEYWREVRKICVLELLSPKRVQSFRFIREEEVALMVNSISHASSTSVNLSQKFFTLTGDIVCRVAFGKSYRGEESDNGTFETIMYESSAMLSSFFGADFFPSIGWIIDILTGLHARLEKSFHDLNDFYERVIDEHLDPKRPQPEQEDILDVLLRLERVQSGTSAIPLTKDHIKAILMNIFLAGVDTSAVTMIWAMTELGNNTRALKKVQDEIRFCVGRKGKVEESDLDKLHFLRMVIKETLRLHPPGALLLPRENAQRIKINGYDIEPKTRIHVNVYAIGRDPKSWEKPEEFFPERFIDYSVDFKGQNFELLPFGAGRRSCPGVYMGIVSVELALANLLYYFNWKLPNGMKEKVINMDESAGLTVHKKYPLHLVPINYNWFSEDNTS